MAVGPHEPDHGDAPLAGPAPGPSPPPHPFLWRCCVCGAAYRLGATRRCLRCAHRFCWGAADASAPPAPPSRPRGDGPKGLRPRRPRRRTRRGPCAAEFDYAGWAAWASGRSRRPADDAPSEQQQRQQQQRRRRRRFLDGLSSCWDDCAFPSECRHVQSHEAVLRRVVGETTAAAEVEEEEAPRAPPENGEREGSEGEGEE